MHAVEVTEVSVVAVLELVWPLARLHVCVSAGRVCLCQCTQTHERHLRRWLTMENQLTEVVVATMVTEEVSEVTVVELLWPPLFFMSVSVQADGRRSD